MNSRVMIVLLVVCSFAGTSSAQTYLWLQLSNHRLVVNGEFESLAGDSLVVFVDGTQRLFDVEEVDEMRILREGSMWNATLAGAGIGVLVGGAAGFAAGSKDLRMWDARKGALVVGIIGGIVGSVAGSMPEPENILDLRGLDAAEKRGRIRRAIDAAK